MSVKALVCTSISNHPNADLLSVYTFSHLDENLTIVANSDNTYELNDVAAIVTSGMLKDGTVIKKVSVRGVLSDGMALGKVTVEPGTDLSDQYLITPTQATSPRFIPWPHIGSLFNIKKYLNEYSLARKVTYKGSVKLDGTNAAVQILTNKVFSAQSRNNIITPQKDNMGFATFAYQYEEYWKALSKEKMVTVFGEWAGKGIQSRCSVSQIKNRVFVVFAILIGDPQIDTAYYIVEPTKIQEFLGKKPENIHVISWYKTPITLDYNNVDELQKSADIINEWVAEVEKCDPWVKETFGIEGLGEGLVFYPDISPDGTIDYEMYKDLVFKAKGDEHKVVNTKKAAQVNPESAASVAEFAKLFLTEARLEQFAKGVYDVKNTGNFLKAFGEDVKRESVAELEASDLEWKDVSKAISEGAKNWYMAKAKSL